MTNELDAYLWNSYMGRPPQGEPNKPNEHGRFGVKFPDRSVLGVVTVEHVGDFEIVLQRVLPEPCPDCDDFMACPKHDCQCIDIASRCDADCRCWHHRRRGS